jgi:hypothetical protein
MTVFDAFVLMVDFRYTAFNLTAGDARATGGRAGAAAENTAVSLSSAQIYWQVNT